MKHRSKYLTCVVAILLSICSIQAFSETLIKVDVNNFVRAESDVQFQKYVKMFDAFGKFHHNRAMYDVTNQITIRANMDTIYSFAVFDLNSPVEVVMPNTDGKYQSLMTVSQDHSITSHYQGKHLFTKESVGTRYVFLVMRTFVDPSDKASLAIAHKLQDAVEVKQTKKGEFSVPGYDEKSLSEVRASINAEANKLPTTRGFFGHIDDLTPQNHLYGAAYGWAGLPEKDAIYEGVTVEKNDGKTPYSITIKDVPVKAFWSISVYNKDGFYTINDTGVYVLNSETAQKNPDGSITINFGNKGAINNIQITDGWNYLVRQYQPEDVLLLGEWKFPQATEVKTTEVKTTEVKTTEVKSSNKVDVYNFVRAETDMTMHRYNKNGGFAKFFHIRTPVTIEKQDVIRMNRDTLYSFGVFDLNSPVTIHKKNIDGRFQSILIINQDHSMLPVIHGAQDIVITKEKVGTRYVIVVARTFADAASKEDMKAANVAQDTLTVTQKDKGEFEVPEWDEKSLSTIRDAINVLGSASIKDASGLFGDKSKLDPISHLLGTAYGWGGNPKEAAMYDVVVPEKNDGTTPYIVTVKGVPVDGFWSITVYNKAGFMEKNKFDAYSFNNVSAKKDSDGSITIHFGGDETNSNYLPITEGWNYAVRMYQPKKELLDSKWKFPKPTISK